MIEVSSLVVRYGELEALRGVDLKMENSEMVALIGANGAGKSTLVNALSGVVAKRSGTIRIDGAFAHVPEGRQLFGGLSVEDNLQLGCWKRRGSRDTAWLFDSLPELARVRHLRADQLSGGQQQMVAIGRALMGRPEVLAVDELSLGLAPKVVATLVQTLQRLNRERGMAILLIEQNARLALRICGRAYVLEAGRMSASASSDSLLASDALRQSYLGGAQP